MTMRTNYFLLLAILLGVIPMSYTHANDSIPKSVRSAYHVLPGAVDNIPSASGILRGTGTSVPAGCSAA